MRKVPRQKDDGHLLMTRIIALVVIVFAAACSATVTQNQTDFGFDGSCVNCHAGMSAGHTHPNYKLRCIDCHGGNDTINVDPAAASKPPGTPGGFDDKGLMQQAHVLVKTFGKPDAQNIARYFFANGLDDDGDGVVDNGPVFDTNGNLTSLGEIFEPLHGEGPGEFVDDELSRDLNYTRFLNPGDLRVATVGCGARNRAAIDGGFGCHQDTVDTVRRSIMVNQTAVTNGAYYGNENFRAEFISSRGMTADPRNGAFAYTLDYEGVDETNGCIDLSKTNDGLGGRGQPFFNSACLEARATAQDPAVAAGAQGNVGLPAFEMAQSTITPCARGNGDVVGADCSAGNVSPTATVAQNGANNQNRLPWGGQPLDPVSIMTDPGAVRPKLDPIPNGNLGATAFPDPVDVVLRTFRAYYPLNYPGSTVNFAKGTFGSSINPDFARFPVNNPFGRGHSSGCSACHAAYDYSGSRRPTDVRLNNGQCSTTSATSCNIDSDCPSGETCAFTVSVVDPTTKPREFDPATQDRGQFNGEDHLIGRVVTQDQQVKANRIQQRTYSAKHEVTAKVDTDTCGLCHGFVTRINYAYQGMAEDEQRDQLARRAPIQFTTPGNKTQVVINDSWVREDATLPVNQQVIIPPAADVGGTIDLARKRDAALANLGFVPGNGGCAAATFSEDCNNNGELDHQLKLTHTDENGNQTTITLDEDGSMTLPDGSTVKVGNGNGKLDLIDRLPREKSVDGRQMHYIYGGRNGSTRQMDIHFERGMHCIDCHFLQDVHGDGHLYTTNWDHIEVECEDCHGTATKRATLKTSGPNGLNDLTKSVNDNLQPFFEDQGGQIIQRSRVTPGLFWVVPQTAEQQDQFAKEAHAPSMNPTAHVGEVRQGSTFAGMPGQSALTSAKLECATCHSSWIHNCLGCHINLNVGDKQRKTIGSDLTTVTQQPGENEIWFTNSHNPGHVDFQLLGLMRAPFVLGVSSSSEYGRLGTFRSSMQALVSVSDATGSTVFDNLTFTTFQATDGNSGRHQVATSGVAMNQTMAHTVRPQQARDCSTCHPLVDQSGRVRNEHVLGETYGIGAGAIPYVGDWAMAAGANGIELYDHKSEKELAVNNTANEVTRFPGFIINGNAADRKPALVEPILDGTGGVNNNAVATDIVLIRNFNPTPAAGNVAAPTFRDLAIYGFDNGGVGTPGALVITDITHRGNPAQTRPQLATQTASAVLTLPLAARALAHVGPDVSDPFVYVAVGTAGVSVVQLTGAPAMGAPNASVLRTVALPSNHTAVALALAGDVLYVGTNEGTIDTFDLSDPTTPAFKSSVSIGVQVTSLSSRGFLLVAGLTNGLAILKLDDPFNPAMLDGSSGPIVIGGFNANNIFVGNGHVYVAAGAGGVLDIDIRTAALPAAPVNLVPTLAPGQTIIAQDVVFSRMPGQNWLLVLDSVGDLWGLKLDNRISNKERCFPDPKAAGCVLDMDFMDETIAGRDPSFDPNTNTFDVGDPSGPTFFHLTRQILTVGRRLARPTLWEQIGTLTGRRVRDSFMPGSGVLSLPVMQQMRTVKLCESSSDTTTVGNLGQLGYADANFTGSGTCTPFARATVMMRGASTSASTPSAGVCKKGDPPRWR
jgi:hypothetical protein